MYYRDSAAEKAMMRLEGKIKNVYAEAYSDIEKKLNDFLAKSAKREEEYKERVQAGQMTQEQFDRWKSGQVFIGKRWRDLRRNIAEEIYKSRKSVTDMINGERKAVFQENANYTMYSIDKDHNFGVSFTLYDGATVTRLIRDNPDLVPDVKYPDPSIDYAWSKKQITSAITQGVLQGESIPKLAKRIGEKLSSSNRKSMVRCARTAMTGAQNSGRIQAMHDAQDMGIEIQKLWIATLDNRTRHAHANLDGQMQKVDDPFESDLGPIMYPGDPDAEPENCWNCRCSLGWNYPKYSNQYDRRRARDENEESDTYGKSVEVPYMTYKEWTNWRKTGNLPQRGLLVIEPKEKAVNLDDVVRNVSYGELFPEDAKRITEDTLKKLYALYPIDHPLEFVGDVRINRGYDLDEEVNDLHYHHKELAPAGAQYISDNNKIVKNGNHFIEVHDESCGIETLKDGFADRYKIRKKYGFIDRTPDKNDAFFVVSGTLEGTITHEYGHAVADSAGVFGVNSTGKGKEFRDWMLNYYNEHKTELPIISQYAASHPDEMFAEMFVQRFDTEHKDTYAFKMADEVMTKFDEMFRRDNK